MPIYEFKCETCHHCFETLVFRSDEKHLTCPECGGKKLQKMMSATSLIGAGPGAAGACTGGGGFS